MSRETWPRWKEPYTPATEAGDNAVGSGDSQTAFNLWPPSFTARLRGAPTFHNVAVSGKTMAALTTDDATNVDPLCNASATLNVLFCWALTNDYAAGATAAQAMTILTDYCTARKAAHPWKIIVGTTLDRGNAPDPTGYRTNRNAGNVLMRANYLSYGADALIDPAADPHLGPDGAYAVAGNPYFNGDTVHITAAGGEIFARLAYDQYKALKLKLFS